MSFAVDHNLPGHDVGPRSRITWGRIAVIACCAAFWIAVGFGVHLILR